MKKILILLCFLILTSCVAGKRSADRNSLYTSYEQALH